MKIARGFFTATAMLDGRILIVGGYQPDPGSGYLSSGDRRCRAMAPAAARTPGTSTGGRRAPAELGSQHSGIGGLPGRHRPAQRRPTVDHGPR